MPATSKGPLGRAIARRIVRAIFGLIGAVRGRQPGDNEGLPWQVVKILRLVALMGDPTQGPPARFRRGYRLLTALFHIDDRTMAEVRDIAVRDDLTARLYRPAVAAATPGASPAIVYFHGGGCVIGDLETHDTLCRYLADEAGIVVLAVDYRLAPENKYPAMVLDAIDAYNWACAHAGELGIDPGRIGVGGDSAGGLITMSLAVEALRPSLGVPVAHMPAFLWTIYPAVDRRTVTDSMKAFTEGLLLTTPMIDWFMELTMAPGQDMSIPTISPAAAADLSGLPDTFILTVGYDPLHDEGAAFAERLAAEGVHVIHHDHPRLLHEFISLGGVVPETRQALGQAVGVLRGFAG